VGGKAVRTLGKAWLGVREEAERMGFRWRPTLVVVWVALALLLPEYHKGGWFISLLGWVGGDGFAHWCATHGINLKLILHVAIPMGLILIMRERLRDYGLGLGKVRTGLKVCAICYILYVPCFIVLFANSGFQEYYASVATHYHTVTQLLIRQSFIVAILCLRTEFLYRGFLLFGLKRHYGAPVGILVQLIPYVLVHSGKAELEALGSLPVGLALGYIAVKTESIWYGALLHGSIALLFNVLILLSHST